MSARLRRQDGFGLVELLIALTVMNVAIFAIFANFNAGALSIRRASRISTAETLAEKQLELYRAFVYDSIQLNASLVSAADALHTSDSAASSQLTSSSCSAAAVECQPVQAAAVGPDGRTYRIDTYVSCLTSASGAPAGGRKIKRVTVVVRKGEDTAANPLARLVSTFDQSTGSVPGSSPSTIC